VGVEETFSWKRKSRTHLHTISIGNSNGTWGGGWNWYIRWDQAKLPGLGEGWTLDVTEMASYSSVKSHVMTESCTIRFVATVYPKGT
jgi:hypothetical protein